MVAKIDSLGRLQGNSIVQIEKEGEKVDAKTCTMCKIIKPLEDFNKRENGLGGKHSQCRKCYNKRTKSNKSDYDKSYRIKHRERLLKNSLDWHYDNQEYANKKRKEHYENNKEHHRQTCKAWSEKNKDYLRNHKKIYARKYRNDNPSYVERQKELKKEHYHKNKEVYAKRWKEYFEANKVKINAQQRKYYNENKEEVNARWRSYYYSPKGQLASKQSSHRRREREKGSIDTLTNEQWENAQSYFKNRCAYCDKEGIMTVDHFLPLSKGGELTVKNVVPCCRSCNSSKQDKSFSSWYPKKEFYSELRKNKILKYLGYKDNKQQMAIF